MQVHKSALPVAILDKSTRYRLSDLWTLGVQILAVAIRLSAVGFGKIFGLLDTLTLLGQVVAAQTRACARTHTHIHTLAHTGFIQVYLL